MKIKDIAVNGFALEKRALPMLPEIRSINEAERTIDFVGSNEAEDRYGDIIEVKGWDIANYVKNPVFLFAHRSDMPPIGQALKTFKNVSNKSLDFTIQFATKDVFPFADTIFKLCVGKFLRATSVGFMPTAQPTLRVSESDERLGYRFTAQELLELSCVPVPANPEALGKAISKHLISEKEADMLIANPGALLRRSYLVPNIKSGETVKKGWFGDTNPPWTYDVPGVTYALDEVQIAAPAPPAEPSAPAAPITPADGEKSIKPGDGKCSMKDCKCMAFKASTDDDGSYCSDCMHTKAMHVGEKTVSNPGTPATPSVEPRPDSGEEAPSNGTCTVPDCTCKSFVPGAYENTCNECGHLKSKHTGAKTTSETDPVVNPPKSAEEEVLGKTVCPFREETKAADGTPWSASKEMAKQTTPAGWKRMCTVIVGDPSNKTSYKLPHHKGSGFAVVERGVNNALARLAATEMSSEDRVGARSHLSHHKKQFADKNFTEAEFTRHLERLEGMFATLRDLKQAEQSDVAFRAICDHCGADYDEVKSELETEKAGWPDTTNLQVAEIHDLTIQLNVDVTNALDEVKKVREALDAASKAQTTQHTFKLADCTGELRAALIEEAKAELLTKVAEPAKDMPSACAKINKAVGHIASAIGFLDSQDSSTHKDHAAKLRGARTIMEKSYATLSSGNNPTEPNETEPVAGEPDGDLVNDKPAEPVRPSHGENDFESLQASLTPSDAPVSFDDLLSSLTEAPAAQ